MRMNREQRRQMLAESVDGVETEVQDVDAIDTPPSVPETIPVPAGVDAQMIAQIVAATVAAMQQANGQNGDALAQAIRDSRKPIPENTDAEYHGISHWHPTGNAAPRPELARETWRGSWHHEDRKAHPREKFDPAQMRDDEIETINALEPGEYPIERLDGAPTRLYVIDQADAHGQPFRRILAFPSMMFQKEHKNQVPDLKSIRRQVLNGVA